MSANSCQRRKCTRAHAPSTDDGPRTRPSPEVSIERQDDESRKRSARVSNEALALSISTIADVDPSSTGSPRRGPRGRGDVSLRAGRAGRVDATHACFGGAARSATPPRRRAQKSVVVGSPRKETPRKRLRRETRQNYDELFLSSIVHRCRLQVAGCTKRLSRWVPSTSSSAPTALLDAPGGEAEGSPPGRFQRIPHDPLGPRVFPPAATRREFVPKPRPIAALRRSSVGRPAFVTARARTSPRATAPVGPRARARGASPNPCHPDGRDEAERRLESRLFCGARHGGPLRETPGRAVRDRARARGASGSARVVRREPSCAAVAAKRPLAALRADRRAGGRTDR